MSVFVLDALRTPIATSYGAYNATTLKYLASPVIKTLLKANKIPIADVDYFMMGNTLSSGGNPARVVALEAGLSEITTALTIDTNCNSGMDAVMLAADKIRLGEADVVIAGAAESYSRRPVRAYRPIDAEQTPVVYENPAYTPWLAADPDMRDVAVNFAKDFGISLAEQRKWAQESHRKAKASREKMTVECVSIQKYDSAIEEHDLALEVDQLSLCLENGEEQAPVIDLMAEAKFADGAGFLVLVSENWLKKNNRSAVIKVGAYASIGSAADEPVWASVDACRQVMEKEDISAGDFSVVEMRESFAVEAIINSNELGFKPEQINQGGGGLARGNPVGAASAVLLVRLFHELRYKQSESKGIASSAAAGGLGAAMIFKSL